MKPKSGSLKRSIKLLNLSLVRLVKTIRKRTQLLISEIKKRL